MILEMVQENKNVNGSINYERIFMKTSQIKKLQVLNNWSTGNRWGIIIAHRENQVCFYTPKNTKEECLFWSDKISKLLYDDSNEKFVIDMNKINAIFDPQWPI